MTDKEYILNELDTRTLLEQLAEESAELGQAALKYIRAHELSKNYTPKTEEEAELDLQEEFSDVLMVAELLELIDCQNEEKWKRWAERLGYKDAEQDEEKSELVKAAEKIKAAQGCKPAAKKTTMKYVEHGDEPSVDVYCCSHCKTGLQAYDWYKFCPYCGKEIERWE